MGQAKAKQKKREIENMPLGVRFQHDAHQIVEASQFLQQHEGARWAHVPVSDSGKEFIGLLFDKEHWVIMGGELFYHPSGTFAGDEMVFAEVETMPMAPMKPSNIQVQAPANQPRTIYNDPSVRFYMNDWGFLQAVPVKRIAKPIDGK